MNSTPVAKPAASDTSAAHAKNAATHPPRQITSRELLGTVGELHILHGERQYCLRITQSGKLILTA